MTRKAIAIMARGFAMALPLPLAIFWLWFALVSYPWIVLADSIGSHITAYENASKTGLALAIVSLSTVLWATGLFGRGWIAWCFGLVLLSALALASIWLYPLRDDVQLLSMRWLPHAVGMIAVCFGMVGLRLADPSVSGRKGP